MNLFHLWFIKYDTVFFNHHPNFFYLRKILRNHYKQLTQCHQTNIQLHLYELIKFIDYFFNLQNIVELLEYNIELFTQNQLNNIEQRTIQFRLMIQCQKIYCEQFWLNKKLNWDVQVRILSTICRIYLFITKVHHFLVGQNKTLWQKSRQKKLFIPIQHWEKFANQIYTKLAKFDKFYYENNYPFLKQIHQLLTSFKILLNDFPGLYHRQIPKQFRIFEVIINENKKYLYNFSNKFFYQRKNYHREFSHSKKDKKTQSLQHKKSKTFSIEEYYHDFNFKLKRKFSLQNYFFNIVPQQLSHIQKKFSLIHNIQKRKKKVAQNFTQKSSSNSEYASTRDLTNRQKSQSYSSKQESLINRQKQFSIFNQRIRVKSRRTSVMHRPTAIKLLQKSLDKVLIQFDLNFIEEKQQNKLSLRLFYEELPYPTVNNLIKISVNEQQSSNRKLKYEGLASKQKLAQKKLKELSRQSNFEINKISQSKYNRFCL